MSLLEVGKSLITLGKGPLSLLDDPAPCTYKAPKAWHEKLKPVHVKTPEIVRLTAKEDSDDSAT